MTASNARLVGHAEHVIAAVVHQPHRVLGAVDPAEAIWRSHVIVVVIEHAVAIEEDGGPASLRGDVGLRRVERLWNADVEEEALIFLRTKRRAADQARKQVAFDRKPLRKAAQFGLAKNIDATVDQAPPTAFSA